jgi:hypothetical protein
VVAGGHRRAIYQAGGYRTFATFATFAALSVGVIYWDRGGLDRIGYEARIGDFIRPSSLVHGANRAVMNGLISWAGRVRLC